MKEIIKVTSVLHALEVLATPIDFEAMSDGLSKAGLPERDIEPLIAHYKLTKVVEANNVLNNWVNDQGLSGTQRKYNVVKYRVRNPDKPSGVGFSYSDSDFWCTYSTVGARLEVGSHEEAMYISEDFEELFEIAWLILPEEA